MLERCRRVGIWWGVVDEDEGRRRQLRSDEKDFILLRISKRAQFGSEGTGRAEIERRGEEKAQRSQTIIQYKVL